MEGDFPVSHRTWKRTLQKEQNLESETHLHPPEPWAYPAESIPLAVGIVVVRASVIRDKMSLDFPGV